MRGCLTVPAKCAFFKPVRAAEAHTRARVAREERGMNARPATPIPGRCRLRRDAGGGGAGGAAGFRRDDSAGWERRGPFKKATTQGEALTHVYQLGLKVA